MKGHISLGPPMSLSVESITVLTLLSIVVTEAMTERSLWRKGLYVLITVHH